MLVSYSWEARLSRIFCPQPDLIARWGDHQDQRCNSIRERSHGVESGSSSHARSAEDELVVRVPIATICLR